MLALPLLLALAVTADAPAAPAVTPAAPTMTAAPAADEEEGPGYHVAPPVGSPHSWYLYNSFLYQSDSTITGW